MPRYLDIHRNLKGTKLKDVAAAHEKDLKVQNKYGVKFLSYWFDEETGTVMCLSEAADAQSARSVHREAHGLMPDSIEEVSEGS